MKGAEELGELLFECSKIHDKVLNWYKQHENDEVFKTDEGIKLKKHLGGMIKQEALALCVLGTIELCEVMNRTDLFISEESYEAFKKSMKNAEYESYMRS